MFTSNGLKSWLVKLLRIMLRISQDISEEILGIVPRKFPGIGSKELFSGNSQEFPQIWSTFSPVILQRNSIELVLEIPQIGLWEIPRNGLWEIPWNGLREIPQNGLREIPRNGLQEIPRNGLREIPRKCVDIFTGFSRERILGISEESWERFLGISAKLLPGLMIQHWNFL